MRKNLVDWLSKRKHLSMERRVLGNVHARCGAGEKLEITSNTYLSLFNKSHAAAYAAISMQTAYLKANFPHEFAVGLLTSVMDDSDKLMKYISSFRQIGINVLPPDVTKSEYGFSIEGENEDIRFGLFAVKGVGKDTAKKIPEERKNGQYEGFEDFVSRHIDFNKTAFENLAKCGAFSSFGYNRHTLCENIPELIKSIKKDKELRDENQLTLFDFGIENVKLSYNMKEYDEYDFLEQCRNEKDATGMYISGHPASYIEKVAKSNGSVDICDIISEDSLYKTNDVVSIGAVITSISRKTTKNGTPMLILQAEDVTGSISILMFEKTIQQYASELKEDGLVFITGRVRGEGEDSSIILNSIHQLHDKPVVLWIGTEDESLSNLRKTAKAFQSEVGGFGDLLYIASKKSRKLERLGEISVSENTIVKARIKFNPENVIVKNLN